MSERGRKRFVFYFFSLGTEKSSFHKISAASLHKDIDECATEYRCGLAGKCTNLQGSYKCECEEGYTLEDNFCTGTLYCQLLSY